MIDIAELLRDAKVLHLKPDDLIVLQLALNELLTPDLGQRIAEAFAPRHVVVLTASVSIGHTDGAVHWDLGAERP